MVDSKTLKISIGAVIKDQEMLRLVPGHLKTKKVCAVENMPLKSYRS